MILASDIKASHVHKIFAPRMRHCDRCRNVRQIIIESQRFFLPDPSNSYVEQSWPLYSLWSSQRYEEALTYMDIYGTKELWVLDITNILKFSKHFVLLFASDAQLEVSALLEEVVNLFPGRFRPLQGLQQAVSHYWRTEYSVRLGLIIQQIIHNI